MRKKYAVFNGIAIILLISIAVIGFTEVLVSPPLASLLDPTMGFWTETLYSRLESKKTITDPTLSEEVTVIFDIYGIPHIYAKNIPDTYFALGYIHARERLWQMDMFKRFAEGKLAEIIGPDVLELDIFAKTIGLPLYAYLTLKELETNETLKPYYNYLISL